MKLLSSIIIALVFTLSFAQPVFSKTATAKDTSAKQSTQQTASVNLNQASAKEIAKVLKGIGLKKAQAIVDYREKHGDFKAIEELASVKGIGVSTIAINHGRIVLK